MIKNWPGLRIKVRKDSGLEDFPWSTKLIDPAHNAEDIYVGVASTMLIAINQGIVAWKFAHTAFSLGEY